MRWTVGTPVRLRTTGRKGRVAYSNTAGPDRTLVDFGTALAEVPNDKLEQIPSENPGTPSLRYERDYASISCGSHWAADLLLLFNTNGLHCTSQVDGISDFCLIDFGMVGHETFDRIQELFDEFLRQNPT